jgi:hypothetical protein
MCIRTCYTILNMSYIIHMLEWVFIFIEDSLIRVFVLKGLTFITLGR